MFTHDGHINNGNTELTVQYPEETIQNGAEFEVCIYAIDANIEKCEYGYDSEENQPEDITMTLFGFNTPEQEERPEQSQSSNSENNNANSNTHNRKR